MTARAKPVTRPDGSSFGIRFECPGCKGTHVIPTSGDNAWGFNGSLELPTLTPSILVYPTDHLTAAGERIRTPRCHSFVREGRIEFLGDCTHDLKGQTVDLPELSPSSPPEAPPGGSAPPTP